MENGKCPSPAAASCSLAPAVCLLPPPRDASLVCRFHGESGVFPRVPATQECSGVFDTFCFEIEHRTGARMFGRSSTIGNNHLIPRQFIDTTDEFIGWY